MTHSKALYIVTYSRCTRMVDVLNPGPTLNVSALLMLILYRLPYTSIGAKTLKVIRPSV